MIADIHSASENNWYDSDSFRKPTKSKVDIKSIVDVNGSEGKSAPKVSTVEIKKGSSKSARSLFVVQFYGCLMQF